MKICNSKLLEFWKVAYVNPCMQFIPPRRNAIEYPQKAILTISHIYDAKDPRVSKFNVGKNEKILVSQKALHFEL